MPTNLLDALLDGPFELTSRPEPIPGDLRMAWGMALVILILGKCRGQRASLQKLHFMAHSTRTHGARAEAIRVLEGRLPTSALVVRVEPWLNRALAFARAAGLVKLERGTHAKLTDEGVIALKRISAVKSVLADEKAFLDSWGPRATEMVIDKIMRMERLL